MRNKIVLAVLLATLSGVASAHDESCKPQHFLRWTFDVCSPDGRKGEDGGKGSTAASAPEMDSTSAMAALTLMLGGLAVMRGSRLGKSKT